MAKKETIESMFDTIAPKYDLLNHLLSFNIDRIWRNKMVRMVYSEPVARVLDVATGTGDVAFTIARKGGASVSGCDISGEMLAIARQKASGRKLTERLEFIQADAEALPWPDKSFDVVTVAFGVRNFETLQKGLLEMNRVLKPGGRAVILEFSNPGGGVFGSVYSWYSKHILPRLGKWISGDASAYTYLPESVKAFPDGDDFLKEMDQAGYQSCSAKQLAGGIATLYLGYHPA